MITRITFIALVAAILAGCSTPTSPNAKIVGTWEIIYQTKSLQQTYSKHGTYRVVASPGGPSEIGTWSIDTNRLTLTFPDIKRQTTAKILKLDNSYLVLEATNVDGTLDTNKWKRIQ